jgi:hypothetical protein
MKLAKPHLDVAIMPSRCRASGRTQWLIATTEANLL